MYECVVCLSRKAKRVVDDIALRSGRARRAILLRLNRVPTTLQWEYYDKFETYFNETVGCLPLVSPLAWSLRKSDLQQYYS